MKPYVVVICMWGAAALFFENAYHAFRFPKKHVSTRWEFIRGLPRDPSGAAAVAAGSLLVGLMLFGLGLYALYGALSN